VETPSHADVLLLCGAGPSSLVAELHQIAESLYEPWICLRLGDCGVETEAVFPGREIALPGCAPEPEEILNALEAVRHGRDRSQAATVLVSGEEGGG
jgi:Ni,Fe-hydrogenase III small subunit